MLRFCVLVLLTSVLAGCATNGGPGVVATTPTANLTLVAAANLTLDDGRQPTSDDPEIRTGAEPHAFKFADASGQQECEALLGPYSTVRIVGHENVFLMNGWLYWRGPRLAGRTRRFTPGPPAHSPIRVDFHYLLQVDPHGASERHFIYFADQTAFKAVLSKDVTIDKKCDFAEVEEGAAGAGPNPISKDFSGTANAGQKALFNHANDVARKVSSSLAVSNCP